jgi:hypothetical protein
LDGRTTRRATYALSQKIRKRIEEGFGWMKTVGAFAKPASKESGGPNCALTLWARPATWCAWRRWPWDRPHWQRPVEGRDGAVSSDAVDRQKKQLIEQQNSKQLFCPKPL